MPVRFSWDELFPDKPATNEDPGPIVPHVITLTLVLTVVILLLLSIIAPRTATDSPQTDRIPFTLFPP